MLYLTVGLSVSFEHVEKHSKKIYIFLPSFANMHRCLDVKQTTRYLVFMYIF